MSWRKALAATVAAALLAAAAGLGWWYLDPRWYLGKELEHQPYPLRRVDIDPLAAKGGLEYFGKVRFDLYIGRDGRVERVEGLQSTMPAAVRDRVVQSFREARWQPGRLGGREVKSVKRIEIDFEPPPTARRPAMKPDS